MYSRSNSLSSLRRCDRLYGVTERNTSLDVLLLRFVRDMETSLFYPYAIRAALIKPRVTYVLIEKYSIVGGAIGVSRSV